MGKTRLSFTQNVSIRQLKFEGVAVQGRDSRISI